MPPQLSSPQLSCVSPTIIHHSKIQSHSSLQNPGDLSVCMGYRGCQVSHVLGNETTSVLSAKPGLVFPIRVPFGVCLLAITWDVCHSGVTSCGAGVAIDCQRGSIPFLLALFFQMETNGIAVGRVPFGYRINLRAALVKMHNQELDNAIHSPSSRFPTCSPSFPYGVTFTQFITSLLIF